jgi:N6-adenosine-specific RNA methylase IME4
LAARRAFYARQAKNTEAVRQCAEIRMRAERKAGELLAQMEKAKGTRGQLIGRSEVAPPITTEEVSLADRGITRKQASQWQQLAKVPAREFEAAVAKAAIPTTNGLLKGQRREQHEIAVAERTEAMARELGTKLYPVIYADPPWRFEPYSRDTGMDRAADNHYSTMTLDQIKAVKIPKAWDCVLFLWATAPMLPQALEVIEEWDFDYKTHCVWVKDKIGTGYWYRSLHELLLVATRGNVPAPPSDQRLPSVFHEPAGRHSEKPAAFAEFIEAWFPHLSKLEMFARKARPGWDSWGNEIEAKP